MKIKEALNSLRNGVLYPVYYLKGNDHYLQNFFTEKIAESFFNTDPIKRNYLHPDDTKGKEIIDRLTTTDLFMSKQIFIIRNPQQIRGKPVQTLLEYCIKPIDNHILLLINDDWTVKNSFLSKIESIIEPIDVQTPFSNDVKKWANYFIKQRCKIAEPKSVDLIVNIAGDTLNHLENEIEKISLLIGERTTIKQTDILEFSTWKRERKLWEFLLMLGEKDYKNSILLGKTLISNHQTMVSLIYPLTAFFQEMLFHKMKNGTSNTYRGYIAIPPSIRKRLHYFSDGFTSNKLRLALRKLNKIDLRIKSQYTSDETELIQFINDVIG